MKRALCLCLCFLVLGCAPAPKELGNNYFFVTTNGYNNSIIKNNTPVVDTYIKDYQRLGNFIVGVRIKSKRPDVSDDFISKNFGYFILNTETGKLQESITQDEFDRFIKNIKGNN